LSITINDEGEVNENQTGVRRRFKREALRLLETSGKAVVELERDQGITPGLLNKWKGRYQINPATEQVEAREERQLEAERELLKKVLRIL
jgi:transposase-like protein